MDLYNLVVAAKLSKGGGGDEPVLIDKTITANGTYNASSDSADGYEKVVVNVPSVTPTGNINITSTAQTDVSAYATAQVVDADLVASNIKKDVDILGVVGTYEGGGGGGSSNVVTGSFTVPEITTEAGTVHSINTGYSGDGYITAFAIVCSSSQHLDVAAAYTYSTALYIKTYNKTSPTYTGTGNANKGFCALVKKSSNLSVTSGSPDLYAPGDPNGSGTTGVALINDKSTIKIYIKGTNTNYYGLKSGETYQYLVLYSE